MGKRREYYMGEGAGFLRAQVVMSQVNEFVLPVACPNTNSDSECELTNLLVGFDAGPSN
jgi:hypothetical protein